MSQAVKNSIIRTDEMRRQAYLDRDLDVVRQSEAYLRAIEDEYKVSRFDALAREPGNSRGLRPVDIDQLVWDFLAGGGSISEAAKIAGISRQQMHNRINQRKEESK